MFTSPNRSLPPCTCVWGEIYLELTDLMRLIVVPDIKKKYWAPLLTWLLALFNSVNKQTDLLGDWTRFRRLCPRFELWSCGEGDLYLGERMRIMMMIMMMIGLPWVKRRWLMARWWRRMAIASHPMMLLHHLTSCSKIFLKFIVFTDDFDH